jgi:ATP-binding cassette subfamily B protein
LLTQPATSLASYIGEDVGWNTTNRLRMDLAEHCLNLDLAFFKNHSSGEMVERVEGDVATLLTFLSSLGVSLATDLLLLLGILVLITLADWRIGLFALAFTIGGGFLLRRVQGVSTPYARAMRQSAAALSGSTGEYLQGLEDITANGGRGYVLRHLNDLALDYLRRARITRIMSRVFTGTMEIGLAFALAAVLTIGTLLLRSHALNIGALYAIFYYIQLLAFNLQNLISRFNEIQLATASVQRINELFQAKSAILDQPASELPAGPLPLAFNEVTFGYSPEQTLFEKLSFSLAPGKSLGLIGRTGGGKTTLSRLLFRFYDPREGSITAGGLDIRQVSLAAWRKRIGLVTQNVQIFQGTIRENLTFFDASVSDEHILRTLEHVGLAPWIEQLPEGLQTPITGQSLSAGEAQLLAFARIFLQNPDIVVFDEASSRLDPVTERLLDTAIAKLLENRTSIIIAHRLETLQRVDDILLLKDGHIMEYGSRQRLAADPTSQFAQLLHAGSVEVLA